MIFEFIRMMAAPALVLTAALVCVVLSLAFGVDDADRTDWPREDWRQP